jgi:hypothetical protein
LIDPSSKPDNIAESPAAALQFDKFMFLNVAAHVIS